MEIPRCLALASTDSISCRDLHIFYDASVRVYRSVAYLQTEGIQEEIHVSFILARSRVAPKKQLSMPQLESSTALTGAQLANVRQRAHHTYQEDHALVRLNYGSTVDQILILSL